MFRPMRLLVSIFVILIGITVWSLVDKEPPSLVKPVIQTPPAREVVTKQRQLIALGDSLTAGYQLTPDESFPHQLQDLFDQENISIKVINAGKSGDTSSQMRERLDRSLSDAMSGDILLLTAWANDGLQWLPLDQLENNLRYMITYAKQRGLMVVLWWMKLPRNYWSDYTMAFDALYEKVATETDTLRIPFILDEVATVPELNLNDGIHPNAEGYEIIAKNVYEFLQSNELLSDQVSSDL
jgi:acyl-CoA thioesterase-1